MSISVSTISTRPRDFTPPLFGQAPSVDKDDYAKWQVDDPRVNLAVSQRGAREAGVNHLGIQAENADELAELQRPPGRRRPGHAERTGCAVLLCPWRQALDQPIHLTWSGKCSTPWARSRPMARTSRPETVVEAGPQNPERHAAAVSANHVIALTFLRAPVLA